MYKKILVPLDGSPLAEAVLPHAQALAKSEGAEIVLLRVPVIPTTEFISRDPAIIAKIVDDMEKETVEYIDFEVAKLNNEGAKASGLTREGSIPDTIIEVARETQADVIAMSTHGRSGLQRLLMGSVAEQVVSISPIPVMLIHPSTN